MLLSKLASQTPSKQDKDPSGSFFVCVQSGIQSRLLDGFKIHGHSLPQSRLFSRAISHWRCVYALAGLFLDHRSDLHLSNVLAKPPSRFDRLSVYEEYGKPETVFVTTVLLCRHLEPSRGHLGDPPHEDHLEQRVRDCRRYRLTVDKSPRANACFRDVCLISCIVE